MDGASSISSSSGNARDLAQARMTIRERTPAAAPGVRTLASCDRPPACPACFHGVVYFVVQGLPDIMTARTKMCSSPSPTFQMTSRSCSAFSSCQYLLTSVVVLKPKDDQEGGREGRRTDACPSSSVASVGVRPDLDLSVFPPLLSFSFSETSLESFDVPTDLTSSMNSCYVD